MKKLKIFVVSVFLLATICVVNAFGTTCDSDCDTTLDNTFLGYLSGYSTTTGFGNTFFGSETGYNTTTGYRNTFLGTQAGLANTTGHNNTFLGYQAGYSAATSSNSMFLGYLAGYNTTWAFFNVFSGPEAGYNNTTGYNNTFSGYKTGYFNTTGAGNTFSGCQAGLKNATGHRNTYLGFQACQDNTSGSDNTILGYQAGRANTSGSGNVFIGYMAAFYETGSNKLVIANSASASNTLLYGDFSNNRLRIGGSTAPSYTLDVTGTIRASGNVIASCGTLTCSDLRYKEDVKPIENALEKITNLEGVSFSWKDKEGRGRQLGVIAQEVEMVFPEVVSTDDEGYKSVGYSNLVAPLIEAVKELKAENDELKSRIQALEKMMKK